VKSRCTTAAPAQIHAVVVLGTLCDEQRGRAVDAGVLRPSFRAGAADEALCLSSGLIPFEAHPAELFRPNVIGERHDVEAPASRTLVDAPRGRWFEKCRAPRVASHAGPIGIDSGARRACKDSASIAVPEINVTTSRTDDIFILRTCQNLSFPASSSMAPPADVRFGCGRLSTFSRTVAECPGDPPKALHYCKTSPHGWRRGVGRLALLRRSSPSGRTCTTLRSVASSAENGPQDS
jgi:hypothetical protein